MGSHLEIAKDGLRAKHVTVAISRQRETLIIGKSPWTGRCPDQMYIKGQLVVGSSCKIRLGLKCIKTRGRLHLEDRQYETKKEKVK